MEWQHFNSCFEGYWSSLSSPTFSESGSQLFGLIAYAKIMFNQVTAMMKANINGVSITNTLTDQIVPQI